jgi:hypothetical protein
MGRENSTFSFLLHEAKEDIMNIPFEFDSSQNLGHLRRNIHRTQIISHTGYPVVLLWLVYVGAQSRQSAKLFLQSSELGLPQPLTP